MRVKKEHISSGIEYPLFTPRFLCTASSRHYSLIQRSFHILSLIQKQCYKKSHLKKNYIDRLTLQTVKPTYNTSASRPVSEMLHDFLIGTLNWIDIRSGKRSHTAGPLCWQWCGTRAWHRWRGDLTHTMATRKPGTASRLEAMQGSKKKVQFIWRNAFFVCVVGVVTQTLRWDRGESFVLCAA